MAAITIDIIKTIVIAISGALFEEAICSKLSCGSVCCSPEWAMVKSKLETNITGIIILDQDKQYMKKKIYASLLIGFLLGTLWLGTLRFVLYQDDSVHYHANFGLYINGERDKFDSFTFYEEVQSCSAGGSNPKERVHMHDKVHDVVHVHTSGATWGHFFANLGYTLGNNVLKTDKGVFIEDDDNKLTFYLNNEPVDTIANRVIESEDSLLIDFGKTTDEEIKSRFDEISKSAKEYNQKPDPSSCKGSSQPSFWDKLRESFLGK